MPIQVSPPVTSMRNRKLCTRGKVPIASQMAYGIQRRALQKTAWRRPTLVLPSSQKMAIIPTCGGRPGATSRQADEHSERVSIRDPDGSTPSVGQSPCSILPLRRGPAGAAGAVFQGRPGEQRAMPVGRGRSLRRGSSPLRTARRCTRFEEARAGMDRSRSSTVANGMPLARNSVPRNWCAGSFNASRTR